MSPFTVRAGASPAEFLRVTICFFLSAFAATAQETPPSPPPPTNAPTTNLVTAEKITLVTKTPLGEAAIEIPSGTTLTNYELQGDRVKVWAGPFNATVDLAALQSAADTPTAAPTVPPTATVETMASEPTPTPSPAQIEPSTPPTLPPGVATLASTSFADVGQPPALPPWLVPAVVGALVTYAFLTTAMLFRSRRRRTQTPSISAPVSTNPPTVTLPSKTKPTSAVVADGGRAIACPLCAKNIPLETVAKGRNCCPSCGGSFVVE